jgi:alanyl-tRNA synthetase
MSPQQGISLFKALPDEEALSVTERFYPLYEKTKSHSGINMEKTSHSKNVMELNSKIMFLKKQLTNISEKLQNIAYLDNLRKITATLDSLPLYYIKQLLDIDIDDVSNAISEFKNIVPENYITTILDKDNKIVNEVETILLSEQFI